MADVAWQRSRPSLFDIAACRFPEGDPASNATKLRPCLVMEVLEDKNTGQFACKVAFGTKVLKLMQRQHLDLIIQNAADLRILGLYRATRFDLDSIATLPWSEAFFGCWSGHNTPVIGTLTEIYIKEFAYLMMRKSMTI